MAHKNRAKKKTAIILAKENNICVKTLKNYIKSLEIAKPTRLNLKEIILLIDATYWGTSFGVVVVIRL